MVSWSSADIEPSSNGLVGFPCEPTGTFLVWSNSSFSNVLDGSHQLRTKVLSCSDSFTGSAADIASGFSSDNLRSFLKSFGPFLLMPFMKGASCLVSFLPSVPMFGLGFLACSSWYSLRLPFLDASSLHALCGALLNQNVMLVVSCRLPFLILSYGEMF